MPPAPNNIWVTRPEPQAAGLIAAIEAAGWQPVAVPTLEIAVPDDWNDLARHARSCLVSAQVAVFVSRNAVDWFWQLLGADAATAALRHCRVLAVGPGTAAALRSKSFNDVVVPEAGADSEALLALPVWQVAGVDHAIIIRGQGGRELLADSLRARGLQVSYIEVYVRRRHEGSASKLPELWQQQPPAAIVVSSRTGLDALLAMTPPDWQPQLRATPLVCLGRHLGEYAGQAGFDRALAVAARDGDAAIVQGLQQHLAASGCR